MMKQALHKQISFIKYNVGRLRHKMLQLVKSFVSASVM